MSLVSVLGCGTWFFPIEEQLLLLLAYGGGGLRTRLLLTAALFDYIHSLF